MMKEIEFNLVNRWKIGTPFDFRFVFLGFFEGTRADSKAPIHDYFEIVIFNIGFELRKYYE